MAFVERYLSKVGVESANAMKVILFELLDKRYRNEYDDDFATGLAAAVANHLFCSVPTEVEFQDFAAKNKTLVESKAKELRTEDSLCRALTCAVYNFCYGRYVHSGRKIGFFSRPFLEFVRALQEEGIANLDSSFFSTVGFENVRPLLNLVALGLYRPLPRTPDSKLMMEEIARFGRSAGSSIVKE